MNFHTPPVIYTGPVYINTTHLSTAVTFYTNIIGLRVLTQSTSEAVLTADGQTPLLILQQPHSVTAKEQRTTGLYHFALLLPNRTELGKVLAHFLENNIPLGAADHLVSEALYLNDPDGNGIEIYADRDASTWQWQNGRVQMATDPLQGEQLLTQAHGQSWQGLPSETIMGHVHLHVADLPAAQAFYKHLGFEVVSDYPQALFLASGQYHHHIAINTWNGKGAPRPTNTSAGLHAFSLVYPNETERQQAIQALQANGHPVESTQEDIQTEDPSGNRIYLQLHT